MMPCKECGAKSSVYLAYASANFCSLHFSEHFKKRTYRTIREFDMMKGVKRLGVALSGGKDSTVLLDLLKPLCDEMRIELIAISIDEGIHGYREKLLAHAAQICKKLGVKHVTIRYKDDASSGGPGKDGGSGGLGVSMDEIMKSDARDAPSCSFCGVFRRWALNKAAREHKLDKLATGHNLDDVVQTLLLNLMRNDTQKLARFAPEGNVGGTDGTGGAPSTADATAMNDGLLVPRIMPLLRAPEREVALYSLLNEFKQPFDECPYAAEALRNQAREFLNSAEEKQPGTKVRMLNAFLSMRPALASMDSKKKTGKNKGKLQACSMCGEPSASEVCKACELRAKFVPFLS